MARYDGLRGFVCPGNSALQGAMCIEEKCAARIKVPSRMVFANECSFGS